jgi:putative heme-binding domain-containing protein
MRLPILALLVATGIARAQHGYTQTDIEEGGRQYRLNCINCHGPDGNLVGGIDFGHGKYRNAVSDDDLIKVINFGVPGAGMPAFEMPNARALAIIAYLRSLPTEATGVSQATKSGDRARGKALFESTNTGCLNCHRVRGTGGTAGPDLTEIALSKRPIEIETTIMRPGPGKALENRPVRIVRKDGTAINGLLLNEDTFTVQIVAPDGKPTSFQRSDLNEFSFLDKSLMPSYQGRLPPQDLADLIAYLSSLKGAPVQ